MGYATFIFGKEPIRSEGEDSGSESTQTRLYRVASPSSSAKQPLF
jgi:hypothetical protein